MKRPTSRMRLRPRVILVAALALLPALSLDAAGSLAPAAIFTDKAVLQRDRPLPVWGQARPGADVLVRLGNQVRSSRADATGRWQVMLPAMPAGGPVALSITSAGETVVRKDILLGDVWLCAGQSNMAFALRESDAADLEIAMSADPGFRFFSVKPKAATAPLKDLDPKAQNVGWQEVSPATAGELSAVAYYFGATLRRAVNVPIGLVVAAWGGTGLDSWTPLADLQTLPFAARGLEAREKVLQKIAAEPGIFVNGPGVLLQNQSGTLYDGMIVPLAPMALKGFLWYQGEQNAGADKRTYTVQLGRLIDSWRKTFRSPDAPFYLVQLPNYSDRYEGAWPATREAQMRALDVPGTGIAVTIDQGEAQNIHPTEKREVGRRLARLALAKTYGKPGLVYSGPIFDGAKVEGAAMRVNFVHVGPGLLIKGGGPLRAFEIAGVDKQFRPASAIIDGATVFIWSPEVPAPVAVRYAWKNNPDGNLFNKVGLPAAPFRSDDWPTASEDGWRVPASFR